MNYLQWLASQTDSVWWHDSANKDELERALSWGAVGMTTNPFLVNQTLTSQPGQWHDAIQDALMLSGDEKVLALVKAVTGRYAQTFSKSVRTTSAGARVCMRSNQSQQVR